MQTPIIFIIFALFLRSANVDALQCYDCYYNCYDPIPTTHCEDQGPGNWTCLTERVDPGATPDLPDGLDYKGCSRPSRDLDADCKWVDEIKGAWCRVCDTDLCNSAEVYTFSVVLLSVVVLFLTGIA